LRAADVFEPGRKSRKYNVEKTGLKMGQRSQRQTSTQISPVHIINTHMISDQELHSSYP
jgi:hypothetical protein